MGWRDERKNAAAKEHPRRFQRRDDSDPRGLVALAKGYLEWMAVKNYSPSTRYQRELYLDRLITWCELRSGIVRTASYWARCEVPKPSTCYKP